VIVALDATPLTMTSGGLPRYVNELTAALSCNYPADQFLLASDQAFPGNSPRLPGPQNWLERRWWLYGAERICARTDVTLFHGSNFAIPYFSRRPTVLTIHDLSPWLNPAWHRNAGRVRNRTPRMMSLATMILTPTEAVRQQVIERFQVAPDRIAVTPLAALATHRPSRNSPPDPVNPYFLFVGTLEPRKNIPLMLESWRELRLNNDVDLVIVGRRRPDFPELLEEPGLRILGEVPDEQLPELYSNAVAVLYPSQYEGFGLPVLEAMQCGACVITSRDPALTEVSGGAAIQVTTPAELASAMLAFLKDPALRAEYAERSLRRARDFSWEKTALMTYNVYLEAIARFGR
jgi:glycosyltransferase involved in cell wall biosynthesis